MTTRFDWVVAGSDSGPDPVCDVAMLSTSEGVVVPTLGAILAGWCLVVPRFQALSLATLDYSARRSIMALAEVAARRVSHFGPAIFLEHGAVVSNSAVGCGVDQAHLHVVPSKLDLMTQVLADQDVAWIETRRDDPWSLGSISSEYYLIYDSARAFLGRPRRTESQYFRKHIARSIGKPDEWDYRGWPHYGNVRRTLQSFNRRTGEQDLGAIRAAGADQPCVLN